MVVLHLLLLHLLLLLLLLPSLLLLPAQPTSPASLLHHLALLDAVHQGVHGETQGAGHLLRVPPEARGPQPAPDLGLCHDALCGNG